MLLESGTEYNDVVEVSEAVDPVNPGEDPVHETSEGGGTVTHPHREHIKFIQFPRGGGKGCLVLILLGNRYLEVALLQVKDREEFRTVERL